jgi:hypothetical protein
MLMICLALHMLPPGSAACCCCCCCWRSWCCSTIYRDCQYAVFVHCSLAFAFQELAQLCLFFRVQVIIIVVVINSIATPWP